MLKHESNWSQAVRHFFSTTTLHGFKYLFSKFYMDRIGWLICCCASACCAGLLCTVLWERFLDVPALLELWDLHAVERAYQHMPLVAICPPEEASASLLANQLNMNASLEEQARKSLAQILSANPTSVRRLQQLELILSDNNISLSELILNYMPSCEEFILKCRWQNMMVPCEALFMKELTPWGTCCVMRPNKYQVKLQAEASKEKKKNKLKNKEDTLSTTLYYLPILETTDVVLIAIIEQKATRFTFTKRLDLALQCSEEPTQGCGFYSTFEVEETVEPMVVVPGYNYFAQLRFTSVPQNSLEDLVGITCNPNKDYNKADCLAAFKYSGRSFRSIITISFNVKLFYYAPLRFVRIEDETCLVSPGDWKAKCAEKACGCTNPLRPNNKLNENRAPPCSVIQLECLRVQQNNSKCNCLSCCNKVTTFVTLESGRMEVLDSALDPIYSDLNNSSTVLHLMVYISLSRIFTMNPTETWFSLLSSLGGVFNMFLGVGLFSALEILFLLFVKLPISFKNSSELANPPPSRY